MQDNRLFIIIKKPVADVFLFTIDPKNTPLWIESIKEEISSAWPIKMGVKYKNRGEENSWNEFTVTSFIENQVFELFSLDGRYYVRYTYRALDKYTTELEYYEWAKQDDLESPFEQKMLEKLKQIVEGKM